MNNHIPEHWKLKKLGDVCEIVMGQSPPSTTYNYDEIGLPFFQGKSEFTEQYPEVNKWCNAPNKIALPNDILLSVRAPVGTTNIANQKCCIGRGLAAIRYENFKYIFYFLRSIEQQLDEKGTGTTFRAISGETIRTTEIPIPPLPEQQAIVSKIEELLSDLENGKQQLLLAQQQLKIYRQSLLKWAFEGRLTNKNVNDGELPKSWRIVELKSITDSIQYGYTESSSKENIGPKFLRITDIQDDKVHWDDVPYCKIGNEIKGKYLLNDGDLVFARTGATVGKSYLIKGDIPEAVFASYLIRVRVSLKMDEKYLSYFFHSPNYWSQITEGQVGIGQPNVNGTKLGQLKITIAPFEEQQLIVDELESKLTVCDKIEETISQSLLQAESLRQSILKKAFEGKLV